MKKFFRRLFKIVLAVVLGALGLFFLNLGFHTLNTVRHIELTPQREIIAVLPGIVNLNGKAAPIGTDTVISPKTSTPCLYYRYTIEEERKSRNSTDWHTISDTSEARHFYLTDDSSAVEINLNGFVPDLSKSFTQTVGKMRYTEYRIDKGTPLFVFGKAEKNPDTAISPYVIKFQKFKGFEPIVSDEDEQSSRRGFAGHSIAHLLFASLFIILACCLFCVGIHLLHSLVVLWCAAFVLSSALALTALDAAQNYVEQARQELNSTIVHSKEMTAQILNTAGIKWDQKWSTLNEESIKRSLSPDKQRQINALKVLAAKMELRFQNSLQRWPESMFSDQFVASGIVLTKEQEQQLHATERLYKPTIFTPLGSGFLVVFGLILLGVFGFFGVKKIKLKRLIENIATTTPGGAVYGLNEISGRVELLPGESPILGPISGKECVAYRYLIQERRGGSRNSRWVTVSDKVFYSPFVLKNFSSNSSLAVNPIGCELISAKTVRKRELGKRYYEYPIYERDSIYALGPVGVSEDLPQLMLQADDLKSPFVISNLSEQDVLVKKASTAFLQLAVSLVGGIAIGLGFAGRSGSFGALPWLLCSLVPIIFLAIVTLVLMYNDLIFLKNRVWATLANIEVSLKKRSTLIPQLETIAKAYFEHEKEFQRHLASLRSLAAQNDWSNADGNRYLASEAAVSSRMLALVESYPNLKGNEAIEKLMTALSTIENELGFMREGYNNSVEHYNTRREHFPELVISKLFGFEELSYLHPTLGGDPQRVTT